MKRRNLTKFIYWALAPKQYLTPSEWDTTCQEYIEKGQEVTKTKTVIKDWKQPFSYHFDTRRTEDYLYCVDGKYQPRIYCLHHTRSAKEMQARVDAGVNGLTAKIRIHKQFRNDNKCSIEDAFGTVKASEYKLLVPKPDYYINSKIKNRNVEAHYIDVSSMYPASACGRLPDATRAVRIQGRVEPNEEFPFAFYLKSHHSKELGVYDTRDYMKLYPAERRNWQIFAHTSKKPTLIYNQVADEDEVTVLMPVARYTMDSVWNYFYNVKSNGTPEEKRIAKFVINAGIGTFHPNPEDKSPDYQNLYHIAAVVIGRANAKQIKMFDHIVAQGGVVLQQIVDSLIYIGKENYGLDQKIMGEYYNEFGSEKIYYRSPGVINRYVIFNDDSKILKAVVSGYEDPVIERPEDIDNYNSKE